MKQSQPVLIVFSILAGAQVLTAGTLLADVIGEQVAGLIVLLVAAIQAGMSFYVSGQVVPLRNVAARWSHDGRVVAGPASRIRPGKSVTVLEGEHDVGSR